MKAFEIGGRLLRSSRAATFSQIWRVGVTFLTQMALRRLVPQAGFGLWHWAAEFVFILLAQLRDLGLPAHVVRDRDRPYGNLFAVELGWGALLAVLVVLGSPLLARGHSHPDTIAVLCALALFLFLEGLAKVPLTFFEAEILIDRALMPEVARNLCYTVVSITLAWAGFNVWSLVFAHIAATGVFAGLLWWRAFRRMPLRWIRRATWPLVRRSAPLMLMALVLLAVESVDFAILGGIGFSSQVLGMYGGALALAMLVPRVLEMALRRALYPTFVAFRDHAERFFATYRLATILLLAVQVPFAFLLFFNAETLLVLLWSESYAPVAGVLRILCWVPLIQPFARCAEDVILTRNEEWILITASLITLGCLISFGIVFTFAFDDLTGMAWAKLLPLGSLLTTWAIYRVHPRGFWRLFADLVVVYGVPALLFPLAALAAGPGTYLRLGLSLVAGALSLLILIRWFGAAFLEFFRNLEQPAES
ncbi:MAG: oligosaccharide flippase family protein [bacterium]|nr:oligosaccharide flippase family protein [bacterium]